MKHRVYYLIWIWIVSRQGPRTGHHTDGSSLIFQVICCAINLLSELHAVIMHSCCVCSRQSERPAWTRRQGQSQGQSHHVVIIVDVITALLSHVTCMIVRTLTWTASCTATAPSPCYNNSFSP